MYNMYNFTFLGLCVHILDNMQFVTDSVVWFPWLCACHVFLSMNYLFIY